MKYKNRTTTLKNSVQRPHQTPPTQPRHVERHLSARLCLTLPVQTTTTGLVTTLNRAKTRKTPTLSGSEEHLTPLLHPRAHV